MTEQPDKPVKVVVTKPTAQLVGELVVACIILFIFWRVIGSPEPDDMLTQAQAALDFLVNGH